MEACTSKSTSHDIRIDNTHSQYRQQNLCRTSGQRTARFSLDISWLLLSRQRGMDVNVGLRSKQSMLRLRLSSLRIFTTCETAVNIIIRVKTRVVDTALIHKLPYLKGCGGTIKQGMLL